MTQPPDDAALVARIKASVTYGYMPMAVRRCLCEAATALEAKDRRIAELESMLSTRSPEQASQAARDENERWHAIQPLSRAALEPSDKGVGR